MMILYEIDGDAVNPYEDIDRLRAPRNRYDLSYRMVQLIGHTITRSTETRGCQTRTSRRTL